MSDKILIVGAGGREHALAWHCAQMPGRTVYVAPGNAGTAREPGVENVAIDSSDLDGLVAFAERTGIDLTIVGPEQPLVAGIVDRFTAAGLACFGPSAAAAALEGSKVFSKEFMVRHRIPTAQHASFEALEPALAYLETVALPVVVKASGLAAGKGVVIATRREQACQAAAAMLRDAAFGEAGRYIVVEEFLQGEEASFIALVDGTDILPLASSQDHKARDEGDRGPNTGGMGAYSPAPVVTPAVHARIMREVMLPTARGLAAEGLRYRGFLYAGVMIDPAGAPRVLEFNCRFGDPEAQVVLPRLASDLPALCRAALAGELAAAEARWRPEPALGVVMAAAGYPAQTRRGDAIEGLAADLPETLVFHAGTRLAGDRIVTAGGRVLCVTGLGPTLREARDRAYARVDRIGWEGAFCRRDIGHRALARED
ncbi:MAG: phosphoribosylamine--glycine ligase [Pseudomonadota bacterium]|nr:phosphoribosylamine--glycine ligase [Pseudomonadota bacterium]HJO36947.1 phosphoribosylamine--glycine ligase [Gammaproteobacteria bacterium]